MQEVKRSKLSYNNLCDYSVCHDEIELTNIEGVFEEERLFRIKAVFNKERSKKSFIGLSVRSSIGDLTLFSVIIKSKYITKDFPCWRLINVSHIREWFGDCEVIVDNKIESNSLPYVVRAQPYLLDGYYHPQKKNSWYSNGNNSLSVKIKELKNEYGQMYGLQLKFKAKDKSTFKSEKSIYFIDENGFQKSDFVVPMIEGISFEMNFISLTKGFTLNLIGKERF